MLEEVVLELAEVILRHPEGLPSGLELLGLYKGSRHPVYQTTLSNRVLRMNIAL